MQFLHQVLINFLENRTILPEVVSNSIVDIRYFGDVVLEVIVIIKIFFEFAPSTVYQQDILARTKIKKGVLVLDYFVVAFALSLRHLMPFLIEHSVDLLQQPLQAFIQLT